tara:strand:+ start:3864 stop:4946 length:1083 start_codon:yes stop_codon:yes gene_type:complete
MKICLIGQNLTNLILALAIAERKLPVQIYLNKKIKKYPTNRTIAISSGNFKFIKFLTKTTLPSWTTDEIKIFIENSKTKEILNFKQKNKEVFNLISYSKLNKIFLKKIIKSKYVKLIKVDTLNDDLINKIKNYDLVINSENNNILSKKYFTRKITKNYKSTAFAFIIEHKKVSNKTALQIFTNYGPLAFLPVSDTKTSIVFSYMGKEKENDKILSLFKKYNYFYKVKKIHNIEKFDLDFSFLRNYTYSNILAFGDLIHRIHPLAGQGFNMTIRDIMNLLEIIDNKTSLGLPIDISVAEEFQNANKHFNYTYGKIIDTIYEFFKIDNRLNNSISIPVFNFLNKNETFKKYSNIFSDRGLNL